MKKILIYLFVSILFTGCSVRSKALLQEQSLSAESLQVEERVIYQDTTITYGGDTFSIAAPLKELLSSGRPVKFQTKSGTITLSLQDSLVIAKAIWDMQEKTIVIPAKQYRSTKQYTTSTQSLKQEASKRQPIILKFWPLWLLLLIIVIYPLLKKVYKCLRFPM